MNVGVAITGDPLVTKAAAGIVVVIVSGRPMIIDAIMPYASAIVAAWLPGTEGDGVAQVLFNNAYNFTGKLSHSWPRAYGDIPINWGDGGYDPLFELGWGLSYP